MHREHLAPASKSHGRFVATTVRGIDSHVERVGGEYGRGFPALLRLGDERQRDGSIFLAVDEFTEDANPVARVFFAKGGAHFLAPPRCRESTYNAAPKLLLACDIPTRQRVSRPCKLLVFRLDVERVEEEPATPCRIADQQYTGVRASQVASERVPQLVFDAARFGSNEKQVRRRNACDRLSLLRAKSPNFSQVRRDNASCRQLTDPIALSEDRDLRLARAQAHFPVRDAVDLARSGCRQQHAGSLE